MNLTPHFTLREFASKDGAPFPAFVKANLPRTARMLEALRSALSRDRGRECPLVVLSGYRSPAHNAKVGGVPNSFHLYGKAADVTCPFAGPRVVQRVARDLQSKGVIGGLGTYQGFTHVDWGPRRTWTQATKQKKASA